MNSDQILYIKILCKLHTTDAKENKDDFDFFFNYKESSINAVFICASFYNTKDEYSKKVLVGFSMKNKI